jgi:transposase
MDKIENAHKLVRWNEKEEHNNSNKDVDIELTELNSDEVTYVEPEKEPISELEEKYNEYLEEKSEDDIQKVKVPKAKPENSNPVPTIESLASINPRYVASSFIDGITRMRNVDPIRSVRGLRIAKTKKLTKTNNGWLVPGDGRKSYDVTISGDGVYSCNCEDFKNSANVCKHIHAVWALEENVKIPSVQVLDKQIKALKKSEKKYSKSWSVYNKVQRGETKAFLEVLKEACDWIDEPTQDIGRPRVPLSDVIFAATYKVYTTISGRRFESQGERAHEDGYIDHLPHYNTVSKYLRDPNLTPLLTYLIEKTSEPFSAVETGFAIDSTGFGTKVTDTWHDKKYGVVKKKKMWAKLHANVGVKTRTFAAVKVTDTYANDSSCLRELVGRTASRFTINEQYGDGAYSSRENCSIVAEHGGKPFFLPSKRARRIAKGVQIWSTMYDIFHENKEEFYKHYNNRNNVECAFNMIKSKMSGKLRSKVFESQANELLCKVLCHNIIVLISELYNLGYTLEDVKESSILDSQMNVITVNSFEGTEQEHVHA